MIDETTMNSNGNVTANDYPPCESDYEVAPAQPEPMPGWRNQFPKFTHNVSWQDTDNKGHSLTIRTDDEDELFAILKHIKHIVRASKEKAAQCQSDAEAQHEEPPQTKPCEIHPGAMMQRRQRKDGTGHFYSHNINGEWCNGRAKS